jgi:hypothetical protein
MFMSTIVWRKAQSGNWNSPSNWNYGAAPTTNDTALFDLPGAYTVSITTPVTSGNLSFNAQGATFSEAAGGSLTLSGALQVYNGLVSLNAANTIGTSVQLVGGVLALGNGAALGNASLLFYGGELLATTSETIANSTVFNGDVTVAVATGQTLTLTGTADLSGPTTVTFGAAGANGTVYWDANSFLLAGVSGYNLRVNDGKLVFNGLDDGLGFISDAWSSASIASGATLDLDGSITNFNELSGSGTLTSSLTTLLTLGGGEFSGNITGDINLDVIGQAEFAGASTIGSIGIGSGSTFTSLTNDSGGVLDLDTSSDIALNTGASLAYFVNYGTVLRNGFAGTNTISVGFLNFGTLKISAGAMHFTNGLVNSGIIEGVMSTSGGGVTYSADNASHPTFYGGSGSDVFQLTAAPTLVDSTTGSNNTIDVEASMTFAANSVVNVQRFVIENGVTANLSALTGNETIVMNAAPGGSANVYAPHGSETIIGGDGVDTVDFSFLRASAVITHNANGTITISSVVNGPSIGADTLSGVDWAQFADQRVWIGPAPDDFNSDGLSDILWSNASGDTALWKSNGSGGFAGQDLATSGSGWQVAGVGDFNGDGKADILWSNASGDTSIWKSNGSGGFVGQDLGTAGSGWQVAGVGDFNGDAQADILWSNASGDTAIWNSNGAGGFTPEDLGTAGNGWKVAGVGDFNGDGEADILWSNAGGDTSIWSSNGSGGFTAKDLGTAGSGWQVVGIGDFNGDGKADILWSNASGDTAIWNSNGAGGFTSQDLATAGSGWQVAGVGDFNGDGKADILWSNASGDAAIWNSNGSGGFTAHDLGTAGSGWKVQAA